MSKWIRKGDRVLVIAGNDRGKVGEVLARSEERVLVQGVNVRKKHLKRTQQTQGGRIIDIEVPIHISNVRLCDKEGTPLKVAVSEKKGEKTLVARKKGEREGTFYRLLNKQAKKPAQ